MTLHRHRHRHRRVILGTLVLCSMAELAGAFPGFARKYSPSTSIATFMPCSGCHDTFPKLTPFGRRFKENGFRVDSDVVSFVDAVKAVPLGLRSSSFSPVATSRGGSSFGLIKGISAAGLGSHISYWIDQPVLVNEDGLERLPVDYAWVGAYDLLPSVRRGLVNVKGGSFELDLPFPQAKTHNLFAYEPYFIAGGDSSWSFASPQRGLEISGRPVDWGRYSVSFTDTVRRDQDSRYDLDIYARFAADVGRAHRVGGFVYDAEDELTLGAQAVVAEHRRIGLDFDLRYGDSGVSLFGLYLMGRDRGVGGSTERIDSHGGFVQLEKLALPWLVLSARYAQVDDGAIERSLALGGFAWFFERLRLSFEYRLRDEGRDDEGVFSIDFVL